MRAILGAVGLFEAVLRVNIPVHGHRSAHIEMSDDGSPCERCCRVSKLGGYCHTYIAASALTSGAIAFSCQTLHGQWHGSKLDSFCYSVQQFFIFFTSLSCLRQHKGVWVHFFLQNPLGPTAKRFFFLSRESRKSDTQSALPSLTAPPSKNSYTPSFALHSSILPYVLPSELCGRYKLRGGTIKSYNVWHCETPKGIKVILLVGMRCNLKPCLWGVHFREGWMSIMGGSLNCVASRKRVWYLSDPCETQSHMAAWFMDQTTPWLWSEIVCDECDVVLCQAGVNTRELWINTR